MDIHNFMSQFYKKSWHSFKLLKKVQCKKYSTSKVVSILIFHYPHKFINVTAYF